MVHKVFQILGYVWICGAFIFIAIGSVGVLVFQGFWEFLWLFNPFNVINYLVMFLIMIPAVVLFWIAEKFK